MQKILVLSDYIATYLNILSYQIFYNALYIYNALVSP